MLPILGWGTAVSLPSQPLAHINLPFIVRAIKIGQGGNGGKAPLAVKGNCLGIAGVGGDVETKHTSLTRKLFGIVEQGGAMPGLPIGVHHAQVYQLAAPGVVGVIVNDEGHQTNGLGFVEQAVELRPAAAPPRQLAPQPASQLGIGEIEGTASFNFAHEGQEVLFKVGWG